GRTTTWNDTVIASTDDVLGNGNDIVLGTFTHTDGLAVNDSYTLTKTLTLTPGFQGRYFLFVQSDYGNKIFENFNETNNASRAPNFFDVLTQPSADLVVSSVSAPLTGKSGQPFTLSWTVANQGLGTTNVAEWTDTVYLTTDPAGKT